MEKRLTKEDVFDFIKAGGNLADELILKIYDESISQVGESAFSEAIEIGIENTIAALYDAEVEDKEILRIVNEHWGLPREEIVERLIWEKRQAAIRVLEQYLKLQGLSNEEIRKFMMDNRAAVKINHSNELWKLRKVPQQLEKAVRENNC